MKNLFAQVKLVQLVIIRINLMCNLFEFNCSLHTAFIVRTYDSLFFNKFLCTVGICLKSENVNNCFSFSKNH